MDLRCPNKLHGRMIDNDILEIACDSRWCGKKTGNLVLHRFSVETGELISTKIFKIPQKLSSNGGY